MILTWAIKNRCGGESFTFLARQNLFCFHFLFSHQVRRGRRELQAPFCCFCCTRAHCCSVAEVRMKIERRTRCQEFSRGMNLGLNNASYLKSMYNCKNLFSYAFPSSERWLHGTDCLAIFPSKRTKKKRVKDNENKVKKMTQNDGKIIINRHSTRCTWSSAQGQWRWNSITFSAGKSRYNFYFIFARLWYHSLRTNLLYTIETLYTLCCYYYFCFFSSFYWAFNMQSTREQAHTGTQLADDVLLHRARKKQERKKKTNF